MQPDPANPPSDLANAEYGPLPPKLAQLEAHERHLYTFKIDPFFWNSKHKIWATSWSQFILHVTGKRFLIEPYVSGKAEGVALTGIKVGLKAVASHMGASATYNGLIADDFGLLEDARKGCVEILYTDVACVGWLEATSFIDRQIHRLFGNKQVKVDFKTRLVRPLVFTAQPGQSGGFSTRCISKEFVEVMQPLLQS